ncbi:GNAT family N-acetyltransferase [Paenibacillus sp. 79R4]|nr:GNAT family N-acetyltransferase [Paenibacillus sp. 79R4]
MDDPLYRHILPDEKSRLQVLNIFFKHYIEMLYPYSDLVTTSERYEAVALIFHSEREPRTWRSKMGYWLGIARAISKSLPICRYIGLHGFVRGILILRQMDSSWLSMLGGHKYLHLDMLAVQEPYRGQGYVSQIMRPLLEKCQEEKAICSLETQTESNLPMYEHYHYHIVKTIPLPGSSLQQYCLLNDL